MRRLRKQVPTFNPRETKPNSGPLEAEDDSSFCIAARSVTSAESARLQQARQHKALSLRCSLVGAPLPFELGNLMGRLIVVSNRVAPVEEGKGSVGGLAVAMLAALRASGGLWFGWSGRTSPGVEGSATPTIVDKAGITYATLDLSPRTTPAITTAMPIAPCGRCFTIGCI